MLAEIETAVKKLSTKKVIMPPSEIRRIRKKLKLKSEIAGQVFGGGKSAFSRYETGIAVPSLGLVRLLQILDKRPELLKEVYSLAEH